MNARKLLIAGNWKMYTDRASAVQLATGVVTHVGRLDDVDVALFPPSAFLLAVHEAIASSRVAMGGQNMHYEAEGAFTGEVSPLMLRDCGCQMVIIGHSERRQLFGEDDELINRKVISALKHGLKPILCVGETLEQRQQNQTHDVVSAQLRHALVGVQPEQFRDVTIAYEPVWAIGTGQVATPEQAEDVHRYLRETLTHVCGNDLAQVMRIQYGGSVKPSNAVGLFGQPNIDGALVGGASLKIEDFVEIVRAGRAVSS